MVNPFVARASRARALADTHEPARDLLAFYASLADVQAEIFERTAARLLALAGRAESPAGPPEPAFRAALDSPQARACVPDFLRWLARHAPRPLAGAAEAVVDPAETAWDRMLGSYWRAADCDAEEPFRPEADVSGFIVEAWLQPLATAAAAARARQRSNATNTRQPDDPRTKASADRAARCPVCASRPVVALLTELGHGARRSLLCGLCDTAWPAMRLNCPACGESGADALEVFRADAYPAVRVDACRACRTYIKTLDLTVDNTAVPAADDLASLPIELWVREQRYARLRPHLLRV